MNNGWELSLGLYPGILLGIRSYEINDTETDHLLYLPLVYICLATIRNEENS